MPLAVVGEYGYGYHTTSLPVCTAISVAKYYFVQLLCYSVHCIEALCVVFLEYQRKGRYTL